MFLVKSEQKRLAAIDQREMSKRKWKRKVAECETTKTKKKPDENETNPAVIQWKSCEAFSIGIFEYFYFLPSETKKKN